MLHAYIVLSLRATTCICVCRLCLRYTSQTVGYQVTCMNHKISKWLASFSLRKFEYFSERLIFKRL